RRARAPRFAATRRFRALPLLRRASRVGAAPVPRQRGARTARVNRARGDLHLAETTSGPCCHVSTKAGHDLTPDRHPGPGFGVSCATQYSSHRFRAIRGRAGPTSLSRGMSEAARAQTAAEVPAAPAGRSETTAVDWLLLIAPGLIWGASFLFIAEGLGAGGPNGPPLTPVLTGFLP